MALTDGEIDRVIARLKKGDAIHTSFGGGRYSYDLVYKDGAFEFEDFQEGTTIAGKYTEAELRSAIPTLDEDKMRRFIDVGTCG